jgi:copper chaperone NosL
MNHSKRLTLYCLLFAVPLAACAPKSTEPQPPAIAYGQDVCEGCGMIIDDAKFAAATITLQGKAHKFDDIGDMLVYHMDHPEEQVKVWFVHDYQTQNWMRGETAFYVLSPQIDSPMGHGLAAFEQKSAAEAFAAERQTTVLTFDEVRVAIHMKVHG